MYYVLAGNNCRLKEIVFHMHCNGGEFMTRYWTSVAKSSSDHSTINFMEYVFGFWNLLTLRPLQKTYDQFTFELYADKSGRNSGTISSNSAVMMLEHIYGTKKNFIFKKAVKALADPSGKDRFTLAEWSEFTVANEGVLLPLQDFQKKERFKLMGQAFWDKKMDSRKKFSRGKSYLNLDETLAANNISTTVTGDSGRSASMKAPALTKKSLSSSSLKRGGKSNSQRSFKGGSNNSINISG
jgi:hypothetical protein